MINKKGKASQKKHSTDGVKYAVESSVNIMASRHMTDTRQGGYKASQASQPLRMC
jgi:hypothetical protein